MAGSSKKTPQKSTQYWRRVEIDPTVRHNAGVWRVFKFDGPFVDAMLVPVAGGSINKVDYSQAEDGVLRVMFGGSYTSLRAIHLYGGKT